MTLEQAEKLLEKEFASLTDSEKRCAIAIDAIQQIKEDKYIAEENTYFTIDNYDKIGEVSNEEIAEAIDKNTCRVCEVGAIFASICRLNGPFTVDKVAPTGVSLFDFKEVVRKYFTRHQLALIESVFEGSSAYMDTNIPEGIELSDIYDWRSDRGLHDNTEAMIAIMENIIENDGEFVLV